MTGIIELAVVTILAIFAIRWAATRLRLPLPAKAGIAIVFVLVVLALWGQNFKR